MKKTLLLTFLFALTGSSQQKLFASIEPPKRAKRFEVLSGVTIGSNRKSQWDRKYNKKTYVYGKEPLKFIAQNYQFIPHRAKVLDVGTGEGRNAVFLAKKGYRVTGVDLSSVAIKKAKLLAKENGVRINTVVTDLKTYNMPENSFDAVISTYVVDRSLNDKMVEFLKPGGILMYEAHTLKQRTVEGFKRYKKEHLLKPGELMTMFPGMRVLKYEEPLHDNNYTASIILQKI